MLAYGGGSIKRNGVYDEITGILKEAGKTIVEFSGIMSNPTYAKVQEGAKAGPRQPRRYDPGRGRRQRHGLLQGRLFGSPRMTATSGRISGHSPGVIDFEPLPLGVVVTVAGTGSECNGGAVITNEEKKVKTGRELSSPQSLALP